MKTLLLILGGVIAILGILLYYVIADSLIVFCFYKWFIIPFFTVPDISFKMAIAIALVLSLFHSSTNIKSEYKDNSWWYLLHPWVLLLCGWLVKIIFI